MKRKKIFFTTFVFMFLLASFWVAAEEAGNNPMAVSPGSETELATIWQSCPTFSWSSVYQAASYRIAVFESVDAKITTYEGMAAMSLPVVSKDIQGPALSWTLSSEESLKTGSMYTWYVQALDVAGNVLGPWSGGKAFKVEQEVRFAGIEEKLAEKMREYGVNEDTITVILKDMKSEVKEVVVRSSNSNNTPDLSVVKGYEGNANTFYGQDAGTSISTGTNNTFVGRSAGYLNNAGCYNTFIGHGAGWSNSTGNENTFIGNLAGWYNSTGSCNTFMGNYAGNANTFGAGNTFIGTAAGALNTIGNSNSFFGNYAGSANTTGSWNTFLGDNSGNANTTGYSNTFFGNEAGKLNTTGSLNTFIGHFTGDSNTTGTKNTFVGTGAGDTNTTGYENTFVGMSAGVSNTTGYWNVFFGTDCGHGNTTGIDNTFIGHSAGNTNSTGTDNTFVGHYAGALSTTANANTFIGSAAGVLNTTGANNTFIGDEAGYNNTTGLGDIFLGYKAGYNESGSNKLYIANSDTSTPLIYGEFDNSIVTVNGKLGIGTKAPTYPIEVDTTGSNSCILVKRTDGASNYINATNAYANFGSTTNHPLRLVVNSAWKMLLNTDGSLNMSNGASCTTGGVWTNASSRSLKENIRDLSTGEAMDALTKLNPVKYNYKVDSSDKHVGFIAEDVPDLVATADRKGLSPMDITAVLTKVVQELQKENQEYKKIISDLQERMAKIEKK
jgi:hypothetical protein